MEPRTSSLAGPARIMLVNLFYPERHPTIGFPVNVESLAGDLTGEFGDGVDVSVLDMQQAGVTVERILETARDKRFDIVGVSVKTGQREIADGIIHGLRALPAERQPRYLMIGGYRPRVYHEEYAERFPQSDVLVCIGEGEPSMRGMLEHLRGARPVETVPNLIFMGKDGLVRTERRQHDLRTWHAPASSTLRHVMASGGIVYLETSRGCSWGKCSFCSRKFSSGTKPSTIPPDRLAAAWRKFNDMGVRYVYCSDEDFMMNNHAHGRQLADALIEAGVQIEFWAQTTVDGVAQLGRASYTAQGDGTARRRLSAPGEELSADEVPFTVEDVLQDDPVGDFDGAETLARLKLAGLRRIFFGLESGSASQLVRYRKGVTADEGAKAVKLCRERGLEVEVGFIPLDPMSNVDEIKETIAYVKANNLAQSTVKMLNLMCVQNGVAMFAKTKQAGLLTGERDEDTFLYPYKFAEPRVAEIADWIHRWHRHGLSEFTYALRRLVDAEPQNPTSTGVLRELRQLEFDYLDNLADSDGRDDAVIHARCMARRFDIMQRCMDAVARGGMADPNGFLGLAFEDSKAWLRESETADVLRL